jgi:tellurite resistance protein
MTGNSEHQAPGALQVYFDVLACVARADQQVTPAERSAILSAATACDLGELALERIEGSLDLGQPFDVDAVLEIAAGRMDPGLLAELLRDAFVLAGADGDVAPLELDTIRRLLSCMGIEATRQDVLMEWARRAAEHHMDGVQLVAEFWPAGTDQADEPRVEEGTQ